MPTLANGYAPLVQCAAQWNWVVSGSVPVVSGYPLTPGTYSNTKTGLQPQDLKNFVGVPIQLYNTVPPTPVSDDTITQWIRWAEDSVEMDTSVLLCQTWVSSKPTTTPEFTFASGLLVNPANTSGYMRQGYDYDIQDAGYDFFFDRAQESGWVEQTLRFRPVQNVVPTDVAPNGTQRFVFTYPMLNQYMLVPNPWIVEERDFGVLRLVPATNVQMLPLYAMQLTMLGFAENVPNGIQIQYIAGLTAFDYASRWAFMKQLVLAEAAIMALSAVQGTINLGALGYTTNVDGLEYATKYAAAGPYAGLIATFKNMRDELAQRAKTKVSGPMFTMLGI